MERDSLRLANLTAEITTLRARTKELEHTLFSREHAVEDAQSRSSDLEARLATARRNLEETTRQKEDLARQKEELAATLARKERTLVGGRSAGVFILLCVCLFMFVQSVYLHEVWRYLVFLFVFWC